MILSGCKAGTSPLCILAHEGKTMAKLTREHNDANILALGQRTTGIETAKDIVHTFLNTPFSNGERHIKRIQKIKEIEEKNL